MITVPYKLYRLVTGDTMPAYMTCVPTEIQRAFRFRGSIYRVWVRVNASDIRKANKILGI